MERESMEFDVLIVEGGPSGLSAAIKMKQLASDAGQDLSVCLIEKGSEVGAHILSGAVLEPRALNELIPELAGKRRAARYSCHERQIHVPDRIRPDAPADPATDE